MPIHTFICDSCKIKVEDTITKGIHKCPECKGDMRWDIHVNMGSKGDYRHVSDSLAMHPGQIGEHKQEFPDIDVLPDGRPEFTSVKQQERYLDKIGMYKAPQRVRTKGKKLKNPSN